MTAMTFNHKLHTLMMKIKAETDPDKKQALVKEAIEQAQENVPKELRMELPPNCS